MTIDKIYCPGSKLITNLCKLNLIHSILTKIQYVGLCQPTGSNATEGEGRRQEEGVNARQA